MMLSTTLSDTGAVDVQKFSSWVSTVQKEQATILKQGRLLREERVGEEEASRPQAPREVGRGGRYVSPMTVASWRGAPRPHGVTAEEERRFSGLHVPRELGDRGSLGAHGDPLPLPRQQSSMELEAPRLSRSVRRRIRRSNALRSRLDETVQSINALALAGSSTARGPEATVSGCPTLSQGCALAHLWQRLGRYPCDPCERSDRAASSELLKTVDM